MKWLLYDSWCFETTATAMTVIRRLAARVDDIVAEIPAKGQPLFEGQVFGNEFRLFRALKYSRKLFLPLIVGMVLPTAEGAIIKVKMRPHGFAITSLVAWFSLAILLPLMPLFTGQGLGDRWLLMQLYSLVFFVGIWLLAVFSFCKETRRGREALMEIIHGAEPGQTGESERP